MNPQTVSAAAEKAARADASDAKPRAYLNRIGGEWLPSSAFGLEPVWRNFTEDHATQHLLHRSTGYVVALSALVLALVGLIRGEGAGRWTAGAVGLAALVQAALGVGAVLSAAALWPSLVHQAGAVALWIAALICARAACGNGVEVSHYR